MEAHDLQAERAEAVTGADATAAEIKSHKMKDLAAETLREYAIDSESVLGKLVNFALQRTRFSKTHGEESIRRRQNEATKHTRRFQKLLIQAIVHRVTDQHLMQAGRVDDPLKWMPNLSRIPLQDSSGWHCSVSLGNPKYRWHACEVLDRAIDLAKREKWVPVEQRSYSLKELRDIAARSGSRFFKDRKPGEYIMKMPSQGLNRFSVTTKATERWYDFNPFTGDFEQVPVAKRGDCSPVPNGGIVTT